MEFMGFHIVDIVIVTLVAFLAIKGLINGLSKELLNFISIVVGIILAARYNTNIIQWINEQDLSPQIPDEFAKILGFIIIVIIIWLIIGFISSLISNLTSKPSGFLSRLAGYLLSAARYVFIFSLIVFGISQADFFKKSATKFKIETKLFEPMRQLGAIILNIDGNETISQDTNASDANKTETNLSTTKPVEINITMKPSSTTLVEKNASN